jgi:hypothetical protein
MKRMFAAAVLALVVAGAATRSEASLTEVTSRADLGGNALIDWGQLGPAGTQISNPVTVTSTPPGYGSVVMQVSGHGERLDETAFTGPWYGNFAVGDHLYYTQDGGGLTLTFSTPVEGIGTQLMSNYYGAFTASITVYDTHGNLLGSFQENGTANGNYDNSAIFLGVLSTSADIGSVYFSLLNAPLGTTPDFAINQVSLTTAGMTAVPEPSSIQAVLCFGLAGIGYFVRKRRLIAKA